MATKQLTLELDVDRKYSMCNAKNMNKEPLVCMVGAGIVSSASIVISGSIVIIGNTLHWLEY